jgi:hypothetical protein
VTRWVIRLNDVFGTLKDFKAPLVGAFFCLCFVASEEQVFPGFVEEKAETG